MTQTLAIFYAAYRNLNSRKLFWISIVISGLVVAAFAMVGINERGIKILTWQIDTDFNTHVVSRASFYKTIFVEGGVRYWLAWIATLLALISTAGIFPDLITGGAVDLYVSKPISRLRLFLTEYVAGLLFVTLQVAVFCLASFLVLGLRGGVWEPGLFVAVPFVVCLFSYLFSVCVLLGVLTRSTVAALLLTLLFWFSVFSVSWGEQMLLVFSKFQQQGVDLTDPVESQKLTAKMREARKIEGPAQQAEELPEPKEESGALATAHRVFYAVKTVLPKTSDTVDLLMRTLVRTTDLQDRSSIPDAQVRAAQRAIVAELTSRSPWWIVGTSLVFEAVALSLAALVFCRRDF